MIDLTDPAVAKLVSVLGREKATIVLDDCMQKAGIREIASSDDRYRLGCELISRGGLLEAIGRAIKIQAILHGARET